MRKVKITSFTEWATFGRANGYMDTLDKKNDAARPTPQRTIIIQVQLGEDGKWAASVQVPSGAWWPNPVVFFGATQKAAVTALADDIAKKAYDKARSSTLHQWRATQAVEFPA